MFRRFEAEADIGSNNNNSFPWEVFILNRRDSRELFSQEVKDAKLHGFGRQ